MDLDKDPELKRVATDEVEVYREIIAGDGGLTTGR